MSLSIQLGPTHAAATERIGRRQMKNKITAHLQSKSTRNHTPDHGPSTVITILFCPWLRM